MGFCKADSFQRITVKKKKNENEEEERWRRAGVSVLWFVLLPMFLEDNQRERESER